MPTTIFSTNFSHSDLLRHLPENENVVATRRRGDNALKRETITSFIPIMHGEDDNDFLFVFTDKNRVFYREQGKDGDFIAFTLKIDFWNYSLDEIIAILNKETTITAETKAA